MILTHNKNLIKNTLGKQGSQQCGVYAVAYGWTILEKKCRVSGNPASHQSVANKYNGGHFAMCYWSTMKVTSHSAKSQQDRYGKIIAELKKGRPVVVAVQGSSANHYVLVIGIRDGKDASNAKPSDFYIIDPADCGFGYFGNTWAHGFNNSSYGLQYCTFNTSSGVSGGGSASGHEQQWYVNKYGNEAKVYFALTNKGLSHKAACAIMGNMKQESGFSPTVVNSIGATGLCQWYKGRCTKMKNYNSGYKWNTINHQIEYLMYELQHGYKEKVYNVLINNNKSLYDMTYAFLRWFEIPGNYDTEIKRRYKNAQEFDKRYSGAGAGSGDESYMEGENVEGLRAVVNMQQRSSQLYSSSNYKWIEQQEKEETEEQKRMKERQQSLKDFLANIKISDPQAYHSSGAVDGYVIPKTAAHKEKVIKMQNSVLDISQAMVESPFVELDFNGTIIGTYNNSADRYPNHISRLEVDKINGEINRYTFELIHQIRPGEDPNLMDKVIAKVRYSTIGIRYGDYNSNVVYGDEKAIITNVTMNRDYVSNRISYTIYATSAGELITSHKLNFSAQYAKPSTIINNLLYKNTETSDLLLDTFPGMKNQSNVYSNNLIPSNDAPLDIDEKTNINTIDYMNYIVSCMSNVGNGVNDIIRKSTYYITYENDFYNQLGGAFFKIHEVANSVIDASSNIYEVTVGYPDNNYVMGFSVDNNMAWSLLYENGNVADEFIYKIDDKGNRIKQYSPNLLTSSNITNEIQKNWWTQMINFPINASLTLKGLMKPIMLMDYVIVNVVFYGQQHITSGIYTITGQKDILSGDGFRTVLALTRIGN